MGFLTFLAAAQQQSMWPSILLMVVITAIFWIVAFAPMRRRQQQLQKLLEGLDRGSRVVTSGGLVGEIAAIEGQYVWLKIADKVKVKILKSAITGLEEAQAQVQGETK